MIFYRALQPLLLSTFGLLALALKHLPPLRAKTQKLWRTWDIRYIEGRPAFYKIDRALFRNRRPIWIHAASGEFEYAKPVIRELHQKDPSRPIVVTYFSPTYADNVRTFAGVTAACPLPLDSRDEMEAFLDYLNPEAFLIARTDAWPNTVLAASLRKIPILLFSTTFHEGSKRMQGLGQALTRDTLARIDQIQCVTSEDRAVLASIGIQKAVVAGDSRYDQVLARLAAPKSPQVVSALAKVNASIRARSLVAGSVWAEDAGPVIQASLATQADTPHTLVLVPHEISDSFLQQLEKTCIEHGFAKENIARLSQLTQTSRAPLDVLIVDSVGLLAELYLVGSVAFVGGSFRKTVHSVMEPLAAGCLTVVGPLHLNNREAIEFQKLRSTPNGPSLVTAVSTTEEFKQVLTKLWRVLDESDFKNTIRSEVAKRGGATAHVLKWLEDTYL